MLTTVDTSNRMVIAGLAGLIALVLILGVVGAIANSGGGTSAADKQAAQDRTERKRQQQAEQSDQARADADRQALDLINAQQEACKSRYLPEANSRADAARQALSDLRASLEKVRDALPPGRAKDALTSQISPDIESDTALINAELRATEIRCALAFTIYSYTHDSVPKPP